MSKTAVPPLHRFRSTAPALSSKFRTTKGNLSFWKTNSLPGNSFLHDPDRPVTTMVFLIMTLLW